MKPFVSALALCLAASPAFAQLRAEQIVSGLSQAVAFVQNPSNPAVQVVVQQNGRVRVLVNGALQANDFLDLRGQVTNAGEQGLLGLAFAPNYATSGRVFVNFINLAGNTVVARFVRSASDPLRLDPASRFDFLWPGGQRFIVQPFANHNGGNMAFGPDGHLYIGMGDGGSGNDPFHLAQRPDSLLGKMLRLDVNVPDSDPEGYNIPPNNPFVSQSGVLGEIWSFGLRNPWRWSFDETARGGTGALIIGDVGQNSFEEIDYEPAGRGGRNYGWRNREGAHNNVTSLPPFSTPLVDPIHEYSRSSGASVTGGFVYRGTLLGLAFRGRYFFGDFVSSRIWSLHLTISPTTGEATASDLREHTAELGLASQNPSSFGVDASGELYVVNYGGTIHRIASTQTPTIAGRRRPPTSVPTGWARPRESASTAAVVTTGQSTSTMNDTRGPASQPTEGGVVILRWAIVRDVEGRLTIIVNDELTGLEWEELGQVLRVLGFSGDQVPGFVRFVRFVR
jgi:glucose/arabinose dehydrogenase